MIPAPDPLRRILVLEDNYLVSCAICELVRDCGCEVAGAIDHVDRAIEFVQQRVIDGAVIDIDLNGDSSFPFCDELQRRKVPFFFLSGYGSWMVPDAFRGNRLLSKPVDRTEFQMALTEIGRNDLVLPDRKRTELGNALLDSLPDTAFWALEPSLDRVFLRRGQMLHQARQPIGQVYFPIEGLISLMARGSRGRRIEVGMVGSEGMTAAAALLDENSVTATEAIVQLPGKAWRISAQELVSAAERDGALRAQLMRYVRLMVGQMVQTAVATGHAKIEQRVARWLLMATARCRSDRIEVTHEHLSQVLAVRRSGITVALHMLETRRVIKSCRKLVEILDHAGLMREADGHYGPSEEFPIQPG